ncbi:RodZ domain-containing protein [Altererythrobacter sp. MF3-039]|uniref:helix-turn-helix domain-containing protein n=1 Tax=Altererythrobacter sp. MF3-039 TaxID=3252901 RepID=UPI00390C8187
MNEEIEGQEEQQLTLGGVGQMLRETREAKGLDLKQVSAETRIPERHLLAIENGDFGALPARTYAVGFSRSYARMLGLDEKLIAADVRAELSAGGDHGRDHADQFDPGDPARIPSRRLAWFSGLAALLLIIGGFSFYRSHIAPGSGPAPLAEDPVAEETPQIPAGEEPAIDPGGEVVFTALEDGIWARFYDGNGSRLFEKQMAKGERFAVPADAATPQIWTGRPDALAITIGGRAVPKLAEEDTVLRDVAIDAASLLARNETVVSDAAPAATMRAASTVSRPSPSPAVSASPATTPSAQATAATPRPQPSAAATPPIVAPAQQESASSNDETPLPVDNSAT